MHNTKIHGNPTKRCYTTGGKRAVEAVACTYQTIEGLGLWMAVGNGNALLNMKCNHHCA